MNATKRNTWLLLMTAFCLTVVSSSRAQVSSNGMSSVTIRVPSFGFVCVGNPLNFPNNTTPSNTLDNILSSAPVGTTKVWDFDTVSSTFAFYVKRPSGWGTSRPSGWSGTPNVLLNPGKGFFIENDLATDITLTFTGEVPQGTQTVSYGPGFSLIALPFPVSGALGTDLGFPFQAGDKFYIFDPATQSYLIYRYRPGWPTASQPTIGRNSYVGVAEGFIVQSVSGGNWTRTFNLTP